MWCGLGSPGTPTGLPEGQPGCCWPVLAPQTPVATLIGGEGAGMDVPAWAGSCPQLTSPPCCMPTSQLLLQRPATCVDGIRSFTCLCPPRLHRQLLPARCQRV